MKWALLDKAANKVRHADLFSEGQLARVKVASKDISASLLQRSQNWNTFDINVTERCYVKKLAYGITVRAPELALQDVFEWLWTATRAEQLNCEYCEVALTMRRSLQPHDPYSSANVSSNLSPDRRVPTWDGGQYEAANLALSWVGCNLVKFIYSVDQAAALTHHLASTGAFELDDLGFLNPVVDVDVTVVAVDEVAAGFIG